MDSYDDNADHVRLGPSSDPRVSQTDVTKKAKAMNQNKMNSVGGEVLSTFFFFLVFLSHISLHTALCYGRASRNQPTSRQARLTHSRSGDTR